MKYFVANLVRTAKVQTPWPRMVLCGFASVCPLFFGLSNGQVNVAIYGALTGYLLALNDHLGFFRHRILVALFTFLLLSLGFSLGFAMQGHIILFSSVLLLIVYWLGIFGGGGAELERAILFSILAMVITFFAKSIDRTLMPAILFYCVVGLVALLFGTFGFQQIYKIRPENILGLRASLRESFRFTKEKNIHAVGYTISTALSIWINKYFQLERGYWITITVLLVMRPDRRQSINTTLQRLFGTALGVVTCQLFLPFGLPSFILVLLAGVSAFIVPAGLKKNYLYASFFVTIFILILLELAAVKHGDTANAFFRLRATAIGCSLSFTGSLISEILSRTPLRRLYVAKKSSLL